MSDDNGTSATPKPQDPPAPKRGGFGAFAQQYRDRWAAGHPNAKPGAANPVPAEVPPRPTDDASPSDQGTTP